jgi:D-alanyl-D-alanine carboxypeptidase
MQMRLQPRSRAGAPLLRRHPRSQARRRGGEGRRRWALVGAAAILLVVAAVWTWATPDSDASTARPSGERQASLASATAPVAAPPATAAAPAAAATQVSAGQSPAGPSQTPPVTRVAGASPAALPACAHDDLPAAFDPAYPELTLVDTAYGVPPSVGPSATAPISEAGLAGRGRIAVEALPDLRALVAVSREAGVRLIAVSGHRTYEEQARVFAIWESRYGREAALRASARPGHSEHQLGFALDFSTHGVFDPWNVDDWATTREGAWMEENGWRFGWVMSYPRDRSDVTCYDYESWHYRWIDREVAAAVHESGLTLREFLWERQQR